MAKVKLTGALNLQVGSGLDMRTYAGGEGDVLDTPDDVARLIVGKGDGIAADGGSWLKRAAEKVNRVEQAKDEEPKADAESDATATAEPEEQTAPSPKPQFRKSR